MRRAAILTAAVLLTAWLALFLKGYGIRVERAPCTYWNGIARIVGENPPFDCPWFGRAYIIVRVRGR